MNRVLAAVIPALLLLAAAPQFANAQYNFFGTPEDALSPPLVTSSNQGAAPLPSTEIAPGASNLLAPTNHVSPYDPLGSALESTSLNPYLYDQANALAPGAIDTLVPDAAFTMRASESAALAGAAAPESRISSWEIKPTPRQPPAGSAVPDSSQAAGAFGAGGSEMAVSAWGGQGGGKAVHSVWIAGQAAPAEPAGVAKLRAMSQGPQGLPGDMLRAVHAQTPGAPASNGASRLQALASSGSYTVGAGPGQIGNFQDSATGSAYAPQASPTVLPSSLLSRLAAEPGDGSPFRDLSTTSFLSPSLIAPLLSGNSFGQNALERERGGLNGAQQRLRMHNGHNLERSEMPSSLERDHRYRNKILEQMNAQSDADH